MRHVLALCVLGLATPAWAGPDIYLAARTPPGGPPTIDATIIGARMPPAHQLQLRVTTRDGDSPTIGAATVRRFADGDETLAIAFVIDTQEQFLESGVLPALEAGLDELGLPKLAPAGSTFAVVSYGDGATLRVPALPLASFHGATLDAAAPRAPQTRSDLVAGVTLAIAELERSSATIKLVVVIGDGNETDGTAADAALRALKKRAARDGIRTFGVIYKPEGSVETSKLSAMIPAAPLASAPAYIAPLVGTELARVADRVYVTFPDPHARLPWDGRDHDVYISIGYEDADPVTIEMPQLRAPEDAAWWHGTWAQLLLGGAAVLLLVIGLRIRPG